MPLIFSFLQKSYFPKKTNFFKKFVFWAVKNYQNTSIKNRQKSSIFKRNMYFLNKYRQLHWKLTWKTNLGQFSQFLGFFTNLKNAQSLLSEYDSGDCVNSETIEVGCAKFCRVDKHGYELYLWCLVFFKNHFFPKKLIFWKKLYFEL